MVPVSSHKPRSFYQLICMTVAAVVLLAVMVVAPLTGTPHHAQADSHKLKVVASFSILGDWITNVAGDKIDLKVLVPAGGDTHSFDPSPQQVADIADADLVFENGAGFETWLDDVYDSSGTKATRVVVSNGVTLRTLSGADADTHGSEHASDADHSNGSGSTDPHIWGNVQNAIIAVNTIEQALSTADPGNAASYKENAAKYIAQLQTLDTWVKSEVAKLPADQRKLVTSHDALGYYTDAYGFTIVGTALGTTTEEAEPSAKQITDLVNQIKASGVKAIFAENIENPALMNSIAKEAGVSVGPVLYTDALGEPGSAGDTYIHAMTYNTTSIVNALLGK
ncbi:MAG: metal ABC transporter solute-binding protein, Zn/Mn family [Thermomicrobiales bacterium]